SDGRESRPAHRQYHSHSRVAADRGGGAWRSTGDDEKPSRTSAVVAIGTGFASDQYAADEQRPRRGVGGGAAVLGIQTAVSCASRGGCRSEYTHQGNRYR